MKYTLYISKEFFEGKLTAIHLIFALIIIVAIIVFFAYEFYRISSVKKRPESFRR